MEQIREILLGCAVIVFGLGMLIMWVFTGGSTLEFDHSEPQIQHNTYTIEGDSEGLDTTFHYIIETK